MDSKISITTEQQGEGFYVAQFKTAELAIFSYYIESKNQAILIDPTFDVKVFHDLLVKRNSTLKSVLLTHYHADFLAGHTQFNVPIIMGKNATKATNKFKIQEYEDGNSFSFGSIQIKVLHTPGHTLQSSCFLLIDAKGAQSCLFSGDTVFLGEVGRPDLATGQNVTVHDLAGLLFQSVQKLKKLDGSARLYPAHGSGSACGKAIGAGNYCNLENQFTGNYGFKFTDKEEFIKGVTTGIPKPPSYFFFDSNMNQTGPSNYDALLKQTNVGLSLEQFTALRATLPVVDTRSNIGEGIIKKSYWLPNKGAITNWLANLLKPDAEFIVIVEEGKSEDIIERFLRIGYFGVKGYNNFKIEQWKEDLIKPQILNYEQFHQEAHKLHLDVRSKPEYESGGVPENAILIPLPELQNRVAELKDKQHLVTSCRTGLRARVAFSILAKHGIQSKVFAQNFDKFVENNIKIVPYTQ